MNHHPNHLDDLDADLHVVDHLDEAATAALAARIEADARPLFLAAMVWICHQALDQTDTADAQLRLVPNPTPPVDTLEANEWL